MSARRMGGRGLATALLALAGPTAAVSATMTAAPVIELRHVALDLQFDWAARQAHGTATLDLRPRVATAQVALDAGQLAIESITLNGRTPLQWVYDGGDRDGGLQIQLDRRYTPGQPVRLRIAYRTKWVNHSDPNNLWGSSGKGLRFHVPSSTEPQRRPQIWASGDPKANRYWYPTLDAPGQLRTSELRATVQAPLQVVAGGRLVSIQTQRDGQRTYRTYHWATRTPEPEHRTTLAVGEFSDVRRRAGKVALHNLGHPNETEGVAASVVQLPDALRFLERITGQPFPHRRYTQVFVQDLPWNTVGTALAVHTENFVDDAGTHLDFQYLWDGLQTESLAQQWFGGRVAVCDWSHVWLERAFAHHLASLYTEHRHGRDEALLWYVLPNQASTLADWGQGVRNPVVDPQAKDLIGFVTGNAPYARGAAVLNTLRMQLGDRRWRAVIRHFVRTRSGQLSCTEHLRQSVHAVSGQRHDWFFDQWVTQAGHPVFEVTQRWDPATRQLHLSARQTQERGAADAARQVAYFQGAVDVEIDAQVHRVWIAPKADNEYTFSLPSEPGHVHFDRGDAWIKVLRFDKPFDQLLHQFVHTRDAASRQWALLQMMARTKAPEALKSGERQRLQAALVEMAGRPAATIHWRARTNALQQLGLLLAAPKADQPSTIDAATTDALLALTRDEQAWVRASALRVLGQSRDPRHAELYIARLSDSSDRVVNAAAIALGRSTSPKAFDALLALPAKPSWKNQSLISALNGLKELGDPRGVDLAMKSISDLRSARWTLATPVWDFRLAAADTLVALGSAAAAVPLLLERFDKSMAEGEVNDQFSNVLLLVTLGDPRTERALAALKQRYADDPNALQAVTGYEQQLAEKLKAK